MSLFQSRTRVTNRLGTTRVAPTIDLNAVRQLANQAPPVQVDEQNLGDVDTLVPAPVTELQLGAAAVNVTMTRDPATNVKRRREVLKSIEQSVDDMIDEWIANSSITTLSYDTMNRMKVCSAQVVLKNGEINTKTDDLTNTVLDPRMGSIDGYCTHCPVPNCGGHHGLISFYTEFSTGTKWHRILNPFYIDILVRILNSYCSSCSCLLVDKHKLAQIHDSKAPFDKRLKAIADYSKNAPCCHRGQDTTPQLGGEKTNVVPIGQQTRTGQLAALANNVGASNVVACSKNPEYVKVTGDEPRIGAKIDKIIQPMSVEDIFDIVDKISDEDAKLLGFALGSHPRNFILGGLLVLPIPSRPPTKTSGSVQQDKLTQYYNRIVEYNEAVKVATVQGNESERTRNIGLLTREIRTLLIGQDSKFSKTDSDFLPIQKRIQGKKAIIRALSLGKRGNQVGRAPISPDSDLSFSEIGIPIAAADALTVGEAVTSFNIAYIQRLFVEGQVLYIVRAEGAAKDIYEYVRADRTYDISIGDMIHRRIKNGDIILANRQPTLTKYSMLAFRVRLTEGLTIKLHPSYTTPLNAD